MCGVCAHVQGRLKTIAAYYAEEFLSQSTAQLAKPETEDNKQVRLKFQRQCLASCSPTTALTSFASGSLAYFYSNACSSIVRMEVRGH